MILVGLLTELSVILVKMLVNICLSCLNALFDFFKRYTCSKRMIDK